MPAEITDDYCFYSWIVERLEKLGPMKDYPATLTEAAELALRVLENGESLEEAWIKLVPVLSRVLRLDQLPHIPGCRADWLSDGPAAPQWPLRGIQEAAASSGHDRTRQPGTRYLRRPLLCGT